ncbi:MAG: fatty-acid oxidation protein subunit alpha [Spirulina sp. SIO3F2]|nr:fatty-acid oxidation protein subunit alpha [Spirulina sp. SIO3F2]
MAKDVFHNAVKQALVQDGWTITHDPLTLSVGGVDMAIDLGAEQLIGAARENQLIAVEVKSFLAQSSAISEFHTALGQFLNYRSALHQREPERILWLAIPINAQISFFRREFPQLMIREHQIKLLIYDPEAEVIVEWKN